MTTLHRTRPFGKSLLLGLIAACLLTPLASRAVVIGDNIGAPNCFPFGCFPAAVGSTYQQVYSAAAFAGPTTFDTVSFFVASPGLMDAATYSLGFSTTAAPVGALDRTWANNIGSDAASFATVALGGAVAGTLSISGNAFTYDPGQGNLLMTILVSDRAPLQRDVAFFQADTSGALMSRLFATGGSSMGSTDSTALRTEFSLATSPVPEPHAYLLMLVGLGLLGTVGRVRGVAAG